MEYSEKLPEQGMPRDNGKGYDSGSGTAIHPQQRRLHDPDVSFQEYVHYACLTRQEQDSLPKPQHGKNFLAYLIPNLQKLETGMLEASHTTVDINTSDREQRKTISDEEWVNASRALRTATAGAVFYLITTDILGPFGLPYAFATTGWG